MGYTIKVPADTNTPGVITEIRQTIDISKLDDGQFKRLQNACDTGVITGRGYIADIMRRLAEVNNVVPPFIVTKANSWDGMKMVHPYVGDSTYDREMQEIIDLANVRQKMREAANPEKYKNQYHRRVAQRQHSRWIGGHYLSLPSWDSTTELRKIIRQRFGKLDAFRNDMRSLRVLLADKPTVTITTFAQ